MHFLIATVTPLPLGGGLGLFSEKRQFFTLILKIQRNFAPLFLRRKARKIEISHTLRPLWKILSPPPSLFAKQFNLFCLFLQGCKNCNARQSWADPGDCWNNVLRLKGTLLDKLMKYFQFIYDYNSIYTTKETSTQESLNHELFKQMLVGFFSSLAFWWNTIFPAWSLNKVVLFNYYYTLRLWCIYSTYPDF